MLRRTTQLKRSKPGGRAVTRARSGVRRPYTGWARLIGCTEQRVRRPGCIGCAARCTAATPAAGQRPPLSQPVIASFPAFSTPQEYNRITHLAYYETWYISTHRRSPPANQTPHSQPPPVTSIDCPLM